MLVFIRYHHRLTLRDKHKVFYRADASPFRFSDQLVELRLRRVTPEVVQLVRQSRDGNYEALAVPSEPAPRQSRPYNDAELEAIRKALEP